MTDTRADRLKLARERAGFKAAVDAARAYGWVQSTYLSHENGQAGLPFPRCETYGKAFGVSPNWLWDGKGDAPAKPKAATRSVPVIGYIGTGAEAHRYEATPARVRLPDGLPASTVALEVQGDSLYPIDPGSIVYFDGTVKDISALAVNRFSVTTLADGRIFVRKMLVGSAVGLFHLFSLATTPLFDMEVVAAAKVLLIQDSDLSKSDN